MNNSVHQLPERIIIDLTDELRPLRDLKIYPLPGLTQSNFDHIVFMLFEHLVDYSDTPYQMCAFAYDVAALYFGMHQKDIALYNAIMKTLADLGDAVVRKLVAFQAYKFGDIFPYQCSQVIESCEVVLKVSARFKNYYVELNPQPFRFNL